MTIYQLRDAADAWISRHASALNKVADAPAHQHGQLHNTCWVLLGIVVGDADLLFHLKTHPVHTRGELGPWQRDGLCFLCPTLKSRRCHTILADPAPRMPSPDIPSPCSRTESSPTCDPISRALMTSATRCNHHGQSLKGYRAARLSRGFCFSQMLSLLRLPILLISLSEIFILRTFVYRRRLLLGCLGPSFLCTRGCCRVDDASFLG